MTVYTFTRVVVWDQIGGVVKVARNHDVMVTLPSSGLIAPDLTQDGAPVSQVTTDATGHVTFTTTAPTVRLTGSSGYWQDVTSDDAVAAAIAAGPSIALDVDGRPYYNSVGIPSTADADMTVADQVSTGPQTRAALAADYAPLTVGGKGIVREDDLVILAEDYGAVGDGVTNCTTAIQNAITAASAGGTSGIVLLRKGTYIITDTIRVRAKVTLKGAGREDTNLRASDTFPADGRPLVQLGLDSDTQIFGPRVESMQLDCNARATKCLYSNCAHEQSGARDVCFFNFTHTGIEFGPGSSITYLENIEVYPTYNGGATYGIFYNGTAGDQLVSRATVGVSGPLTDAVYVKDSQAAIVGLHVENCVDGVDVDQSNVTVVGISGGSGIANVTNLVHMRANSRYTTVSGALRNLSTNTIVDDFFGVTVTDLHVPFYAAEVITGRLRHIGDAMGFYGATVIGKPTVTGSRGGNAALASLLTALASLGLVTDSTTA